MTQGSSGSPDAFARAVFLIVLLGIGIGFDQLTKYIAEAQLELGALHQFASDSLRVQLVYNDGAFLSLGSSLPEPLRSVIFRGGVLVMLCIMLGYALRAQEMPRPALIAFGLCIAGGGSNLIDRFLNDGAVVDFLNVGIGALRTGIFNVADMYIMLGAGLLIVAEFRVITGRKAAAD